MNKINIGCGWECREGWLNVDSTQKAQRENYPITFMDATKPWPYEDNTFDYALSEHMIEHVPEKDGLFMLKEALRTLKPGGVIRVSCPDRDFFENLPGKDNHEYVKRYCEVVWNRQPTPGIAARIAHRTLNEQGHVWVVRGPQLVAQLNKAGFSNVKLVEFGKSEHEVFDGLELREGWDSGMRAWDSIIVEGTKA